MLHSSCQEWQQKVENHTAFGKIEKNYLIQIVIAVGKETDLFIEESEYQISTELTTRIFDFGQIIKWQGRHDV